MTETQATMVRQARTMGFGGMALYHEDGLTVTFKLPRNVAVILTYNAGLDMYEAARNRMTGSALKGYKFETKDIGPVYVEQVRDLLCR